MTNLYFDLDRSAKTPLHKQLIIALKDAILIGEVKGGEKLPASRTLARDLKVSRIVTLAAYEQLIAEGYLISRTGAGTFVNENVPIIGQAEDHEYHGPDWFNTKVETVTDDVKGLKYDFSIGNPASQNIPIASWKRAWRRALDHSFVGKRPTSAGLIDLRNEIATHLWRTRNIKVSADNIIVTSGVAETLRLISKAMADFNPTSYVENPGFEIAGHWLSQRGCVKPINIDKNGLRSSELPAKTTGPTMLFVTPSHQFPLGFRLSLKRRVEILNWARDNDALILEDDYDSEFHYDAMALPTLKSQDDGGHVLYLSSFSKSLSPNIRIGYLVAPDNICRSIEKIIESEHAEPPFLMQQAMAYFIEDGALDKHIARSRRHYAKLNKIMREKLDALPSDINVSGLDSGIHAFLSFKEPPTALIKRLKQKDIHVPELISDSHWHGFSLGYGHFKEGDLKYALDLLIGEAKLLYPEL